MFSTGSRKCCNKHFWGIDFWNVLKSYRFRNILLLSIFFWDSIRHRRFCQYRSVFTFRSACVCWGKKVNKSIYILYVFLRNWKPRCAVDSQCSFRASFDCSLLHGIVSVYKAGSTTTSWHMVFITSLFTIREKQLQLAFCRPRVSGCKPVLLFRADRRTQDQLILNHMENIRLAFVVRPYVSCDRVILYNSLQSRQTNYTLKSNILNKSFYLCMWCVRFAFSEFVILLLVVFEWRLSCSRLHVFYQIIYLI